MRSFILVAVVLQLAAIITHSTGYNFGDIIAFPRECDNNNKPNYIHFGVYVGGQNVPDVGQGDNDIFELRRHWIRARCGFRKLGDVRGEWNEVLMNYLDNNADYKAQATRDLVAQRIKRIRPNCGIYVPSHNNCEHKATYVRYNEEVCLQLGAKAERGARLIASTEAYQKAEGSVVCTPYQAQRTT